MKRAALGDVTNLKHATGSAVALIASGVGMRVVRGIDPTLLSLTAMALGLSWYWRRTIGGVLESLKRGVQLLLLLYFWVLLVVLLALLLAPLEQMKDAIRLLLVSQLCLCLLITVEWGYPVMLFNTLLLMITAAVLSTGGLPLWCAGYMVLMTVALLARHQELRLHELTIAKAVRHQPTARQTALACGVVLALQGLIIPFFPDLRIDLAIAQLGDSQPRTAADLVWAFTQATFLVGGAALVVWLSRKLLAVPLRGMGQAEVPSDIQLLLQAPESRGQTRRITKLRIFLDARERVVEEYCWLLRRLSRQGSHRSSFQTGREFLELIARLRPELSETLVELTALFYRARYSDEPMTKRDVTEAHRLTRRILALAPPPRPAESASSVR